MTYHRIKVYEAREADTERLVVDTYADADSAADALLTAALREDDRCVMRLTLPGVSQLVNSHRSVESTGTETGEQVA